MIIKLHGTSGAGKTTAVRELMALAHTCDPIVPDGAKKPEAYRLQFHELAAPVFVLGNYDITCGGMDTVSSVGDQVNLIHKYAEVGHVVYEGLLLSTYYGSLGKAVERYGNDHVWAFMDTPIEECIARVKRRREEAGNFKPLNEDNTRARMKPIDALKNKVWKANATVVDIHHTNSGGDQLLNILLESDNV